MGTIWKIPKWSNLVSHPPITVQCSVIWNINENDYKYNFLCPFWDIYNRKRQNSASLIDLYYHLTLYKANKKINFGVQQRPKGLNFD